MFKAKIFIIKKHSWKVLDKFNYFVMFFVILQKENLNLVKNNHAKIILCVTQNN